MCHAYVNDALQRPVQLPGTKPARAMKYAYLFVPEFVRAAHNGTDTEFLSLLFVEAGGVSQTCYIRDPMILSRTWTAHQMNAIGDLQRIHSEHVCHPVASAPPSPLRIKIPPLRTDDLYS